MGERENNIAFFSSRVERHRTVGLKSPNIISSSYMLLVGVWISFVVI